MTKKSDDSKKPAKKPGKGKTEKPAKETAPKGRGKAKGAERDDAPPPVEPPPPPPAPAPPAASDDAEGWMDGKRVLEQIEHVLNGCPKPKEQPALAFVLLLGDRAVATDERTYCVSYFEAPVSESALKVTRASVESLREELKGSLNGAAKMEESALIRWRGLVASIRRTGSTDEHPVLLSRFEGGPDAAAMSLEVPAFADGSHATLSVDRLHNGLTWKGDGTAHVFVSAEARQVWIQVDVGGVTIARTVLAFDGSHLGIRQPTLPMDVSGRKPAPAQVVNAEVVPPPGGFRALPAGLAWVRVECDRGAAWERLTRQATEMLAPFSVEPGPGAEGGLVVWGPYPREAARVRFLFAYLRSQGVDPRVVPCDGVNLWARALAEAATSPPLGLEAGGGVAGQLGAGGDAPEVSAFPEPDCDVCVVVGPALWDSLTEEERGELESLATWDDERASHTLTAAEASKLAAAMTRMGLRAAKVERINDEDGMLAFWTVGRAGEKGGASS